MTFVEIFSSTLTFLILIAVGFILLLSLSVKRKK